MGKKRVLNKKRGIVQVLLKERKTIWGPRKIIKGKQTEKSEKGIYDLQNGILMDARGIPRKGKLKILFLKLFPFNNTIHIQSLRVCNEKEGRRGEDGGMIYCGLWRHG